jgi:lipopolysaccharide/colanic/teichoic acid biosynthesis glycosyltransferase
MTGSAASWSYAGSTLKRTFDLCASGAALLLLSPVLAILGACILATMGRPILFVQERVGRSGRPFRLLKLRTMRAGPAAGPQITARGDLRVTPLGAFLRATKFDELPQLFNVLRGDMSIVGPRPEVARYVAHYTASQRRILDVRPGLSDPATVQFRDEEAILGQVAPEERESFYVQEVMPKKVELNLAYLDRAGFWPDLGVILATLVAIVRGRRS